MILLVFVHKLFMFIANESLGSDPILCNNIVL